MVTRILSWLMVILAVVLAGLAGSATSAQQDTPNATGVVNCGFKCHTIVAKKDYIFTAYGKR